MGYLSGQNMFYTVLSVYHVLVYTPDAFWKTGGVYNGNSANDSSAVRFLFL